MQGAGAMAAGVLEDRVAVASTGVIGVPLDTDKVIRGIADARRELAADGDDDFGEAIRTTDAFPKNAALQVAAAVRHRAAVRAGQGRRDDLARLRDDALLRRRPTRRWSPRPPTCCSACASSARSTASRSTGSSPPTTPRS